MVLVNVIITFVSSFLIWFLFAGLFVLWVIDGKIKKEQVVHALAAIAIAWVFSEILKGLIPTTRPFRLDGLPVLTITTPHDNAFPSTHTAIAFALGVTIWLHDRKWGIFFLVGALAIGIARVIGNVHYPIDILGGAIVGSVVAIAIERVHLFNLLAKLHK